MTQALADPHYWDRWHTSALKAGVMPQLAEYGRTVMRDHYQHGLPPDDLGQDCDGPLMLDLALAAPYTALKRFVSDVATRSGLNGDGVSLEHLVRLLGSLAAVDDALTREKPTADAVWRSHSGGRISSIESA